MLFVILRLGKGGVGLLVWYCVSWRDWNGSEWVRGGFVRETYSCCDGEPSSTLRILGIRLQC